MARFNEGIENNELITVNDTAKNTEPPEAAKEQDSRELEQPEIQQQPQNYDSQKKADVGKSEKESLDNQELENNQEKDGKQVDINENQPVPEVKKEDDEIQPLKQTQAVPNVGKPAEDEKPNNLESEELELEKPDTGNNKYQDLTNQENATKDNLNNKQLEDPSITDTPPVKEKDNSKELVQLEEDPKLFDSIREINKPYYDEARVVAKDSPDDGRYFTDHGENHTERVTSDSLGIADGISDCINRGGFKGENTGDRVALSPNYDKKTLGGSALSHDTGMGGGYTVTEHNGKYDVQTTDDDFGKIRDNHSLNSAINILKDRDKYRDLGYTDTQIDKMAATTLAHSGSNSGVKDLNSKEDWNKCFDKIDAVVDYHNENNPDNPIQKFNREAFEKDDDLLGSLATETLALRIADQGSRVYEENPITQSGEKVYVDKSSIDSNAGTIGGEIKNANVMIGDDGDKIPNDASPKAFIGHIGESNIAENNFYPGENGNLISEIAVKDGSYAPCETKEAIGSLIKECASTKDGTFDIYVNVDSDGDKNVEKIYNELQHRYADHENIEIHFPWDKEQE